jgi:hypothetical protein
MDSFRKQPNDILDYTFDAREFLDAGDSLLTADFTVADRNGAEEPAALQLGAVDISADSAKVWVSGGTDYVDYKVTGRLTTAGGRVVEHEVLIKVRER